MVGNSGTPLINRGFTGEIFIAYGKRGSELRHISEVARGLECNCTCVECDAPLIARQGDVREPHFAHLHQSACQGGVESILHRLAKDLFTELLQVSLPEYRLIRKEQIGFSMLEYNEIVCKEHGMTFTNVDVERHLGDVIPDLILTGGAEQLLVEIAVTHRVDATKLSRLKERDIPVVEIGLSARDAALSRAELADKLARDLTSKKWLFHPAEREHVKKSAALMSAARQRLKAELAERSRRRLGPSSNGGQRPIEGYFTRPGSSIDSYTWNRFAENFNRKFGRYPNVKETQAFEARHGRNTR